MFMRNLQTKYEIKTCINIENMRSHWNEKNIGNSFETNDIDAGKYDKMISIYFSSSTEKADIIHMRRTLFRLKNGKFTSVTECLLKCASWFCYINNIWILTKYVSSMCIINNKMPSTMEIKNAVYRFQRQSSNQELWKKIHRS